jgi:hypothetical protein
MRKLLMAGATVISAMGANDGKYNCDLNKWHRRQEKIFSVRDPSTCAGANGLPNFVEISEVWSVNYATVTSAIPKCGHR